MRSKLFAAALVAATPLLAQRPAPEPMLAPEPPMAFAFRAAAGGQSFLGVAVAEVDSNRARELHLKEEHGVEITRIEEESAAAKAGLKTGDVVQGYNGQRVEGMEQFIRLVRETPAGREVKLMISRNGAPQTIPVTLGTHKGKVMMSRTGDWFDMPEIPMPDIPRVFTTWSSSMLGIEAESLTRQLGEYFGVKEGVLVRSVVKGSAAEKAGLKAGDVIVKVDQNSVTTPSELTGAVHSARAKKTFPVEFMRDRHPTTVNVTMDDDRSDKETAPRLRERAHPVKM